MSQQEQHRNPDATKRSRCVNWLTGACHAGSDCRCIPAAEGRPMGNTEPPVRRQDIERADREADAEPDRYCPTCADWYPATSTEHEGH